MCCHEIYAFTKLHVHVQCTCTHFELGLVFSSVTDCITIAVLCESNTPSSFPCLKNKRSATPILTQGNRVDFDVCRCIVSLFGGVLQLRHEPSRTSSRVNRDAADEVERLELRNAQQKLRKNPKSLKNCTTIGACHCSSTLTQAASVACTGKL